MPTTKEHSPNQDLDYKILATGSKGNAVRIESIMFDCGIPFKHMKEELYKCRFLCITHTHKDHINPSTLKRIRKDFPRIQIIANYDVAYTYPVDIVAGTKPIMLKKGITLYPFEGQHDVPVTGYVIDMKGCKILYATDTCKVINPIDDKLDYIFLESNYDEKKLRMIGSQYIKKGYDPYANAERHLSRERCKAFWFGNRRNADSPLIELHMSERFY